MRFILVDKPKGITSHDVVDRIRQVTGEKKVGHAGTLDPNATGLVLVAVGRESTKQLGSFLKNKDKTYIADVFLGETRDTLDVEGEVSSQNKDLIPSLEKVKSVLKSFSGEIEQIPPKHSAIKINGKKAYDLARRGKEVKMPSRKVVIHSIKLIDYNYPIVRLETKVSAGTYIRSLARDIGETLGTGAYLKELRRTKIGEYEVGDAIELEKINDSNI